MAKNTIDFQFRARGADKVKSELKGLAGAVDKEASGLASKSAKRAKKDSSDSSQSGGGGVLKGALSTALGQAGAKAFSTFNRNVAQAFDPNLSAVEKELNVANAALDLIPFEGGSIPKAMLAAATQETIGAAQGTGARLNQALGPAFQASAGLDDADFNAKFGPIIDKMKEIIQPQEEGRERGSQLIASKLDSFLDKYSQEAGGVNIPSPQGMLDDTKEFLGKNTDALIDLVETLTQFSVVGFTRKLIGKLD